MGFRKRIKKALRNSLRPAEIWLTGERLAGRNQLLIARLASLQVRSMKVISTLHEVEFAVSSQFGEDGIIDWLVEMADIPPSSQTFVEFGVESYRESNTRFLLQNRNWRGLIMDSSRDMIDATWSDGISSAHNLTTQVAFITRENIDSLIKDGGFSGEIGVLSIDVDGNDYWIWQAVDTVKPIIVVCEYNAVFGDVNPIAVPYDADFRRARAHYSWLYFGASIAALRSLASRKGYRFVGTTLAGNDAFFVREDYACRFVDRSIKQIKARPSLFRESRDQRGKFSLLSGLARLDEIAHLPVVQIENNETVLIRDLSAIYSDEWLELMTGTTEIR